ncbi:MAG: single-stranded DNA-binding protein [Acidobacteria bacterium]|nr:single-stranded DNA-binding protein [Acidobacteriota bacterium]
MASFNKITIVGYLGRDPELKHTPQGSAVCKFSVATSERRKNADGEPEDLTTWFRVTCWNQTAEFVGEHLRKGQQVFVEGRLRLETYTDREGAQRTSLEVGAAAVYALGKAVDTVGEPEMARPQTKDAAASVGKEAARAVLKAQAPPDLDEDDIPF